jgi:hypothetical protein
MEADCSEKYSRLNGLLHGKPRRAKQIVKSAIRPPKAAFSFRRMAESMKGVVLRKVDCTFGWPPLAFAQGRLWAAFFSTLCGRAALRRRGNAPGKIRMR